MHASDLIYALKTWAAAPEAGLTMLCRLQLVHICAHHSSSCSPEQPLHTTTHRKLITYGQQLQLSRLQHPQNIYSGTVMTQSHSVTRVLQLLHITIALQLCNVIRAAQEQRQSLVQLLWLDLQDAPLAI